MYLSKSVLLIASLMLFNSSKCIHESHTTDPETSGENEIELQISVKTNPNAPVVNRNLYGFTLDATFDEIDVNAPAFVKYEKELAPPVFRWPGGVPARFYHWNRNNYGYIQSEVTAIRPQADAEFKKLKRYEFQKSKKVRYIDELVQLCKYNNTSVIICANVISGTPHEMNEQLRFLQKQNIQVLGVELGNELYYSKKADDSQYTIKEYIQICKPFADSVHAYFPGIPVAVTAGPCLLLKDNMNIVPDKSVYDDWNRTLSKEKWFDAYVCHFYCNIPCLSQGGSLDNVFSCAGKTTNLIMNNLMDQSIDYYSGVFGSSKKMWITEWNIAQKQTKFFYANTLLQALYVDEFYFFMINMNQKYNNIISLATYQYLGGTTLSSAAITPPRKEESYRDPDGDTIIRRCTFYANLLIKDIFNNNCSIAATEVMRNSKKFENNNFTGYSFYDSGHKELYFYFVNKTGTEVTLKDFSVNGKNISAGSACTSRILSGDNLYSSFGITRYSIDYPKYNVYSEVKFVTENTTINKVAIAPYCAGYIKINLEELSK